LRHLNIPLCWGFEFVVALSHSLGAVNLPLIDVALAGCFAQCSVCFLFGVLAA
jgi:hypothetical protein